MYERFGVKEFWLIDYNNKTIEQYILIDGVYQLYNVVTIMSNWDYHNRLTEAEREAYTTMIKPTIFKDLEIDIRDIFID